VRDIEQAGFQITNWVLRPSECDELLSNLTAPEVLRGRAGARHLISVPFVSELAGDPRLRAIAAAALDSEAFPYRVTLFDKSADSNWSVAWHQDTALPLQSKFEAEGWGAWSVKAGITYAHAPASVLNRIVALRVHLDESTSTNGPLCVFPRTHQLGVLSDEEVGEVSRTSSPVVCLVARGGVLAMKPLLIHSSSRVLAPGSRRVLHIEYADDLQVASGVHLAAA
jgi:hypothetical protein